MRASCFTHGQPYVIGLRRTGSFIYLTMVKHSPKHYWMPASVKAAAQAEQTVSAQLRGFLVRVAELGRKLSQCA